MERHLGDCVRMHTDILSVFYDTQARADFVLFYNLVSGAVAMCLTMFLTRACPPGSFEMFLWFVYLALIFQEMYMICWSSSQLNLQCSRVSDALYFSNWMEASPSYKRSMQIIMSRAVVPVEITTASFMVFNMEVFTNVVNSAYSYFKVMTQITKSKMD